MIFGNNATSDWLEPIRDGVPYYYGLVNYLHFLSLIRSAGYGLGDYGLLIVDVEQVLPVFFLQSSYRRIAIPLNNIGLCWFEFMRKGILAQ